MCESRACYSLFSLLGVDVVDVVLARGRLVRDDEREDPVLLAVVALDPRRDLVTWGRDVVGFGRDSATQRRRPETKGACVCVRYACTLSHAAPKKFGSQILPTCKGSDSSSAPSSKGLAA